MTIERIAAIKDILKMLNKVHDEAKNNRYVFYREERYEKGYRRILWKVANLIKLHTGKDKSQELDEIYKELDKPEDKRNVEVYGEMAWLVVGLHQVIHGYEEQLKNKGEER